MNFREFRGTQSNITVALPPIPLRAEAAHLLLAPSPSPVRPPLTHHRRLSGLLSPRFSLGCRQGIPHPGNSDLWPFLLPVPPGVYFPGSASQHVPPKAGPVSFRLQVTNIPIQIGLPWGGGSTYWCRWETSLASCPWVSAMSPEPPSLPPPLLLFPCWTPSRAGGQAGVPVGWLSALHNFLPA